MLPGDRHDTGIAELDTPLGIRRILLLADRDEFVAGHDEPTITGRLGRLKTDNADCGAVRQVPPSAVERVGPDKRRVPEENEDVVPAFADRIARTKHGMGRSQPLRLYEAGYAGTGRFDKLGDGLGVTTDHDRNPLGPGPARCGNRMENQRQPRDLV
nr:MGC83119 protein [Aureimonas sp. AU4]